MESIQFINVKPQEYQDQFFERLKEHLEKFKTELNTQSKHVKDKMTVKEVCDEYKISRTKLYKLRKKELVKAYGLGRQVLFNRSEIEKCFKELEA